MKAKPRKTGKNRKERIYHVRSNSIQLTSYYFAWIVYMENAYEFGRPANAINTLYPQIETFVFFKKFYYFTFKLYTFFIEQALFIFELRGNCKQGFFLPLVGKPRLHTKSIGPNVGTVRAKYCDSFYDVIHMI